MKLLAALAVVLLGVAGADDTFRPLRSSVSGHQDQLQLQPQPQHQHQSQHQPQHQQQHQLQYSGFSNYDDQSSQQNSFHYGLEEDTRRTDLASILGGINPMIIVAVVIVVIGGVVLAVSAAATLSSSGRGVDSDQWEIDHSVWMDQLHKDFEDSWSSE